MDDVQSCLTNTCGSVGESQGPVNEQPIKKALTSERDTLLGEEQNVKVIAKENVAIQHSRKKEKFKRMALEQQRTMQPKVKRESSPILEESSENVRESKSKRSDSLKTDEELNSCSHKSQEPLNSQQ